MMYIIYGTDEIKARAKWHAVIDSLLAKRPDVSLFTINAEQGTSEQFSELLAGQTLFDKKYIVGCDHLLKNAELSTVVTEQLSEIAEAEHMFVFLEASIDKKLLTKLEKKAFKVVAYDLKEEKKATGFNIFALTDALGSRDRRQLWVLYQQVLRTEEFAEEEIFWKLVWQVKNLLLVKTAAKPEKLGLHPYALRKTLGYAGKFTIEDLQRLYNELTELYHDTRRGKIDFAIGLEQFVLGV